MLVLALADTTTLYILQHHNGRLKATDAYSRSVGGDALTLPSLNFYTQTFPWLLMRPLNVEIHPSNGCFVEGGIARWGITSVPGLASYFCGS